MSRSRSDWGASTDHAWEDFSERLGQRLIGLEPGQEFEVLLNGLEADAQPKGIRFERRRRSLRQRMLPATEGSTVVEFAIADSHDALLQALATLRVDLDVIHPAFLDADFGIEPMSPMTGVELLEPCRPRDREHLDQLLDQFFLAHVGDTPERDEDGDIAIEVGESVVYLRASQDAPVVNLFCLVATDISDQDAALYEVNELNRRIDGVNFFVVNDRIHASAALIAMPLLFDSLNHVFRSMCELVASNDRQLARRTGGRTWAGQGSEAQYDSGGDLHPVMLSILQLDADRPGWMRPKTVAKICGHDPELVLELIKWNECQEIAWRDARDDARLAEDDDEADVCEHERAHAERTKKILRKALKRILEV
ncbi:MAG TPA: hypothetical protein P5108_04495 [Marmoricola sp.]|nr:hypothetical protein [Nocardioidaceae bacterium]MCB8993294.1 hypothetical protein [Nocardioidaceae bacterium]MCO5323830.1 hypothetical protein [Nocardioidaceae bacterium]HRV68691.1 hypothetical protein [Marmoricola sp.]